MRQLTMTGKDAVDWLEVSAPRITDPRAAIVRPVAVSVCDFDRGVVTGFYNALRPPIALGHETVGEVIEVGAAVETIKPGMMVALPLHISCGGCPSCSVGHTNSCESRPPLSNYGLGPIGGDWGGGMSDFLAVPFADAMAAPLPDGVAPVDCAAMGCNLADIHRTLAPYAQPDARVLVVSGLAHNMAFYGVAVAKALGVRDVDFLDDDAAHLETAAALGANPIRLGVERTPRLYPIVVDCSALPERLALSLRLTGPDGVCTNVWPFAHEFTLPVASMFLRNVTFVTGQPNARVQMSPVLELIRANKLSSTSIPHELLDWEEAPRAYGRADRKQIFVRT